MCVCVLNKAMGDAVGWPSPVRVWGWFGRVNAFPQLLVHLGWCLPGSSPVLTLCCPSYQLHRPRVDATKGWGSPTTEAVVVCHLHVEGAATEAGLLLTVARGGVLGTRPALDTFKGRLSLRTVRLGSRKCFPRFPQASGRGPRTLLLSTYSRQLSA